MELIKRKQEIKQALISALFFGLLVHGYIIFNKISYHDDIFCLFTLGGTYGSGRWTLGILGALAQRLVGGTFSAPGINGIVSVILIAIATAIVVELFQIKEKVWIWVIAGIMEVFPVVTSTFAYMFTAPYYMLAIVLAIMAAYLISKQEKWIDIKGILAVGCMAGAIGIYQAYFGMTVSLVLVYLIWNYENYLLEGTDKESFSKILITSIRSVIFMGIGMVAYALLNKLFLYITHYELSDYRGVNTMFEVTPMGILTSVRDAYASFLSMFYKDYVGLTSVLPIRIVLCVIWMITIICLIGLTIKYREKKLCNILLWIMVCLLPLAFNIVNVMVSGGDTEIHTLMLYSLVMMFVFPIAVISKTFKSDDNPIWHRGVRICTIVAVFCVIFVYAVIDNQAYLRTELLQNQAKSFYNRLITRIESVEGYEVTDTLYIVGDLEADTSNLTEIPQFPAVSMIGYTMTTDEFINDYAWKEYIRWQLGTDFKYDNQVPDINLVNKMNCYPNSGSIQRENGTIIIKFGNES